MMYGEQHQDMNTSPIVGGVIAVEANDSVNLPMVDSSRIKPFDSKISTTVGAHHQSTQDGTSAQEDTTNPEKFSDAIAKANSRQRSLEFPLTDARNSLQSENYHQATPSVHVVQNKFVSDRKTAQHRVLSSDESNN